MISKLPEAHNKHLVVIQFLDNNELFTGKSLATMINQNCRYIANVHYFPFFNGESLKEFLSSNLSDFLKEDSEVIIYIDSHGTENSNGIATKQDAFLDWDTLVNGLKIACDKLLKKPILILTACNGIGINKVIDQLEKPVISKLIAGNGEMKDGPVLGAFCNLLESKGTTINSNDVMSINDKIKIRFPDHPNFEYIEYKN